ncbi:FG-GAP-like repeat-containing protein [Streptomyces sp. NPDC050149]|uniref:FG-GAP-like repeat-containing protein n=1 Tax=Streptomyces sp. NPDC050149 TaxID=3365603 RepID=UPI0037B25741
MLLAASLVSAGAVVPAVADTAQGSIAVTSGSVADGSLSEEDAALQQAQTSGVPVEIVAQRTEVSDMWANPDGSFSTKRYGAPVRVMRNGTWVTADPTLVFAADGTVTPRAAAVDVMFSGGGSGPLLSGVKDGRTLSLTWPNALPQPTLDANVATYAEILPGVDLQLKAEIEGFSQLIVVKSAQAAANPALATLKYQLNTVGLSVAVDSATKTVEATDPAGQNVFTSPSPLMWDSATSEIGTQMRALAIAEDADPAAVFEAPPGAQDAEMATTVNGGTLEITPDPSLLKGTSTTYPVYIDPSWSWGERDHWTRVYRKYPGNSYLDANEVARVGYENETLGLSRSFFQFDIGEIKGAQVKSSTFRIKNTWSWSCQDRPVELWHTSKISKATTWNNQPAKYSKLATVDDAKGWRGSDDCPAGNLEFDVTPKLKYAAGKSWDAITLGMYASDESDTYGWKKFDPKTMALETTYNTPPKPPYALGTNPKSSCTSGGLIGNTTVSLHATLDDPEAGNLTAEFQVFKSGTATPVISQSLSTLKRRAVTLVLPAASTPTGSYTWKVRAKDHDGASSDWSATCKFTLDRTRPSNPPTISSIQFPDGTAGVPASTGAARTWGTFTLAPNAVADAVAYTWWTDFDPDQNEVSLATAGTSASVKVRPPGYGPHFLYAYSIDAAGNRSDTATYLFYASRSSERDSPGDLNGDTHKDIWTTDSNGTLLTYAGQGDGTFASATNGGQSFDNIQTTYRADWGQEGYTDLVTLEDDAAGKRHLWTYPNNGQGIATTNYQEGRQELDIDCPFVIEPGTDDENPDGCPVGYNHWHDASQIMEPGDLNGDTNPDLLVKQGNKLWLYFGHYSKKLDKFGPPVLVGGTDWDKYTVLAPGDLNADAIPDLWLRDNATGDVWRSYGTKTSTGKLNLATWGTNTRTKIRTGLSANSYPGIGTVGDFNGDNLADLWVRKSDNSMYLIPGQNDGTFGSATLIDGANGGARIPSGTTITPGQSYASASVTMELTSGKLIIKAKATGAELWATPTTTGTKAIMQTNGNLVLYNSDDTVAWQSATSGTNGYAILYDRGNLTVHNAKGESLWSSGTHTRQDYNGDGRSDVATWYDYADGTDKVHTWSGGSDGALQQPSVAYSAVAGTWTMANTQRITGDFNGDGRSDIGVFYGYSDGAVKLYTWLARTDGTFGNATASWSVPPGSWTFHRMTSRTGDYNGDGRDDVAVWYDYADGSDKIFTFLSKPNGTFNNPFSSFTRTTGWTFDNLKLTTGDYNGDGRDDLAAMYFYPEGEVKMLTLLALPTGGFNNTAVEGWSSTSWGSYDRTSVQSGDFNGDGKDDIASWYDYADGTDSVITFTPGDADGSLDTREIAWKAAAGRYTRDNMRLFGGDFNGDGRDDLAANYGYDTGIDAGTVKMITWVAKPDGTFNEPLHGAEKTTGWTYDSMRVFGH